MSAGLEDAIEIAVRAHRGQTDKAGRPYILHPLRVMLAQSNDSARIAAVLHDVVEDSDIELADLKREGFSPVVVEAVDCLTRREDETYAEYIGRVRRSGTHAVLIKIADLRDNLGRPGGDSLKPRYTKALAALAKGEA